MSNLLFAHQEMRPVQEALIATIQEAIGQKQNCIVHAPTGLGKTAAVLAPVLAIAKEKKLTIFFLTSRHTQHQIVLETIKKIRDKYARPLQAVSIIGKKWMCSQENTDNMASNDFAEFCKVLRENNQCQYYTNTKSKTGDKTVQAKQVLSSLKIIAPNSAAQVLSTGKKENLCPYELSLFIAQDADVIVTDYYYIFHDQIRDNFLQKIGKSLGQSIIIVDEGHNLPMRAREMKTSKLTTNMVKRAVKEAKKYHLETILPVLTSLEKTLVILAHPIKGFGEKKIKKEKVVDEIQSIYDYDQLTEELHDLADKVRKHQKSSAMGGIALFLEGWLGPEEGFSRILKMEQDTITISHRCLDPSVVTSKIFEESYASIVMSGTLTPVEMYKDLLGLTNTVSKEFESPFPQENKLALIVPKTTTKYSMRSEEQFEAIAKYCAQMANAVPGNVAIFFPSYALRDNVAKYFSTLCEKTQMMESAGLSKEQKQELLDKFKGYQKTGAVLLGAAAGSFGEGIDLPGDLLKAVIVVGLPLDKPDLETQELIAYFDKKCGKGWDYGYILPAITKTLQNAGRCIRTETDRGVIVFLDERYSWPMYLRCFPTEWQLKITTQPKQKIEEFFRDG